MPVSVLDRTRNRSRTLVLCAVAVVALVAGCSKADDASSIVRTTTNIAGAGVVGLERDTAKACPLPSAPDQAGGTRSVTHAAGVSQVSADPQRIVVLSTAALDAACALGLWERVVGAVTIDGPRPQPQYLGYGVVQIPAVGSAAQPDLAKIAELRPDVILGESPDAAAGFAGLQQIAPTVLVGTDGGWQAEFLGYASGLGRATAAEQALADYRVEAANTGNEIAANQSQASVVRFTSGTVQIQGTDSFAGQVLADAGVQRPTAQRAASFDVPLADLEPVEGDVVYVMFDGKDGKTFGEKTLRSDEFKDLSAATDKRVFAAEDSVWHGNGVTAARALLTDLRNTLNGYVTD
ncbi:ABC transporter substrate-binding protein [Nocardia sp. XZ_19_385]|uniref:ABC transporter substrate-binding protein n=1 Tax=Nocardia sp. XZ_19_385 TaxID=2769488 RepID=UPI00188F1687|nr:ABC transporter substrate-binding protein [Nocardia sp. XZ_19_385]